MSKMSELSQVLDELISCGEKMIQTANAIKECFNDEAPAPAAEKPKAKAPKKKEEAPVPDEAAAKTYSKEEVRGVLAAKANADNCKFKAAVKEIVKKYGNGGSLTNVEEKDYAALVAEVEALT